MSNADEMRWRQRLDNFSHALAQLSAACNQPAYTDLERSGLIQTFEFTFELAWKTLKDLLFYEGYNVSTPRAAIRQGFAAEYLGEKDCETLLDALGKRNLLSHTYRKELAQEAETLITTCYHPALARLHATLQAHRPA
ncbi:MAG: HI0074 family nucleotidyltransferase substrate-binding subunit [Cyanobacteria bacterium MAG CAR4_bin_6]|nr:HI0074 family nucleotidyltransferase substrate-binding subunit [Cyanobacteria bacterium MAG CAR4_bin_6]